MVKLWYFPIFKLQFFLNKFFLYILDFAFFRRWKVVTIWNFYKKLIKKRHQIQFKIFHLFFKLWYHISVERLMVELLGEDEFLSLEDFLVWTVTAHLPQVLYKSKRIKKNAKIKFTSSSVSVFCLSKDKFLNA